MAKQTGLGCALYAGGYDVSGDTQQFTTHGGPLPLDMTDITQSGYGRLGGLRDAGMDWTSFMDTATGAEHDALSPLTTSDLISTIAIGPLAIGSPAVSQVGKQIGFDPTRGQDGMLTFALATQPNAFGQEWGRALTPGRRVDTTATAASSANSYDTGGALSFGAQMYVHLFAFAGTSVTISVWDSADNSSFLAVASLTTTALTTAHTTARVAIGNTATVRRYIAVATAGTFSSADFFVQVTKNDCAGVSF